MPLNGLPPDRRRLRPAALGVGCASPLLVFVAARDRRRALRAFYRYSVTRAGVLAAGANPRAAEMSGVPVGRVYHRRHILSGVLAGVAAMMLTVAQFGAAHAGVSAARTGCCRRSSAPVLGGTPLAGGFVSVVGTMLGATPRHDHPHGPARPADRQFLAAAVPRAVPAGGGPARSLPRRCCRPRARSRAHELCAASCNRRMVGPARRDHRRRHRPLRRCRRISSPSSTSM